MTRFARGRCVLVAGLCFAAYGCGSDSESGPKLTGRVLVDGKPCRPASLFEFDVKFIADQGDSPIKKSYLAVVQEDVHGPRLDRQRNPAREVSREHLRPYPGFGRKDVPEVHGRVYR